MTVRQFKLANGEEIVCEVVEWNDADTDDIVIRKAMKIQAYDDLEEGMRYFTFKPWMAFETNPEVVNVLNAAYILGEHDPCDMAFKYWSETVAELTVEPSSGMDSPLDSDLSDDENLDGNVISFKPSIH